MTTELMQVGSNALHDKVFWLHSPFSASSDNVIDLLFSRCAEWLSGK